MVKERQDITGINCIKGASGKVIVDDKGIRDSWKEYMEKLMNKDNEWDRKISAEVKEGAADCIRIAEVRAVLKKMKRHKAPELLGLVAEMIQAAVDTGTQWLLDLCNGIVKEGCIPEDWKSSVVLPIYKGKGDTMECGSYRGIKLLEHAMKVVEKIFGSTTLDFQSAGMLPSFTIPLHKSNIHWVPISPAPAILGLYAFSSPSVLVSLRPS